MIKLRFALYNLVALLCISIQVPAQAAMVSTLLQGDVITASSNPFGLTAGDTVTLDLYYDDALVSSTGDTTIEFDDPTHPDFAMKLVFGNAVFTEHDEIDFGSPSFGPEAYFFKGALVGVSYITDILTEGLSLEIRDFGGDEAFYDLFDINSGASLVYGEFGHLPSASTIPLGSSFAYLCILLVVSALALRRKANSL